MEGPGRGVGWGGEIARMRERACVDPCCVCVHVFWEEGGWGGVCVCVGVESGGGGGGGWGSAKLHLVNSE